MRRARFLALFEFCHLFFLLNLPFFIFLYMPLPFSTFTVCYVFRPCLLVFISLSRGANIYMPPSQIYAQRDAAAMDNAGTHAFTLAFFREQGGCHAQQRDFSLIFLPFFFIAVSPPFSQGVSFFLICFPLIVKESCFRCGIVFLCLL